MQCRDIELALEEEGLGSFSEATRTHVAECRGCRELIADFTAIVSVAEKFPKEVAPPPRVWVALRNQLEAEGVIRQPALRATVAVEPWWQGFSNLLRGRAFAGVAVAALLVAAAAFQLRNDRSPAPAAAPDAAAQSVPVTQGDALFSSGQTLREQERDLNGMLQAGAWSARTGAAADVDSALRANLQQLDEFIAECELHLKEAPNDALAREYLAAAYQQKAELLSAMIDRGRSVN